MKNHFVAQAPWKGRVDKKPTNTIVAQAPLKGRVDKMLTNTNK